MMKLSEAYRDWIGRRLRIETHGQVLTHMVVVTLVATAIPMIVVAIALAPIRDHWPGLFYGALGIACAIPLFLAPPIAFFALHIFRKLSLTIRRLDMQIRFDPLTSLLNRTYFLDQMRACDRGGAVLIIDADHFKRINDNYGHDVGDEALRILGRVLRETVGSEGHVGRLGGEEFCAYLPGIGSNVGALVADAICQNVRNHVDTQSGHDLKLTVSIGVSVFTATSSVGAALKRADQLLYAAKHAGRDQVMVDGARPGAKPRLKAAA